LEAIDVPAGAECGVGAAHHGRTDVGMRGKIVHDRGQVGDHRAIERILRLRPVERNVQDAAIERQLERFAGWQIAHQWFFRWPGRMPMPLLMIPSMISSAPPPMEVNRESRYMREISLSVM